MSHTRFGDDIKVSPLGQLCEVLVISMLATLIHPSVTSPHVMGGGALVIGGDALVVGEGALVVRGGALVVGGGTLVVAGETLVVGGGGGR